MDIRKYQVRFVHKVGARCKCGHPRNGHHDLHVGDSGSEWGQGPCTSPSCDCTQFEHGDVEQRELVPSVVEFGETRVVAEMLRRYKLLGKGEQLSHIRRERLLLSGEHRLVCFPRASVWHSIIVEPLNEQPFASGADVVRTAHSGIYRIRWTRDGRCYVNSTVNGGLIGAFVGGRWDTKGRLPTSVREIADALRPEVPS